MKDFRQARNLKDTLAMLLEKMSAQGIELPILVNPEAFKEDDSDFNVYDVPIRFAPEPAEMTVARFLDAALAQLPVSATYFWRPWNYIEITTSQSVWMERLERGALITRRSLRNPDAGSPEALAIRGGLVDLGAGVAYLTLPTGGIDAVELASGKVLWTSKVASRPLALLGNRLLAASAETIANSLRLVVLDRSDKGKLLVQSDPVLFPSWASVQERWGRQLTWTWRIHEGHWYVQWKALAWWDQKLETPWDPGRTVSFREKMGVTRISLNDGCVHTLPDEVFPRAQDSLPDELHKIVYWRSWLVPPVIHGKRLYALEKKSADGKETIVLHGWDTDTGKSTGTVHLFQGAVNTVRLALDQRHVSIVPKGKSPPAGEWIFDLETGRRAFQLRKHRPNTGSRLVAGKRVFGLKVSLGPIRESERRLVRSQNLQVIDPDTGRLLWERRLEPLFTAPYAERLGSLGVAGPESVASLIDSLKIARDPVIRRKAAEALGHIGPSARLALPVLAAALKDSDPLVCLHAAEALLRTDPKHPTALAAITSVLKHPDREFRARAAETLGLLGERSQRAARDLSALVRSDPDPLVRGIAANALGRLRPEPPITAIQALAKALKDPDSGVRFWAAGALIPFDRSNRIPRPVLAEALKSSDTSVRTCAFLRLRWSGEAALVALCEALKDDTLPERAEYAKMLGHLKTLTIASFPNVLPLLWDEDREVSFLAALTLLRVDKERASAPAADVLCRLFRDTDWDAGGAPYPEDLIIALGSIGPRAGNALPLVASALENPDLRIDAALALARITGKSEPSLKVLLKVLADFESGAVDMASAALALNAIRDLGPEAKTAAPAMIKLLKREGLQVPAAVALWRIGQHEQEALETLARASYTLSLAHILDVADLGPEAKPFLTVLERRRKKEGLAAAFGLCRIAGEYSQGLPLLVRGLRGDSPEGSKQAAEYLAKLGPKAKAAVPALIDILQHRDFDVYQATVLALNRIDPETARREGVSVHSRPPRKALTRPELAALWKDLTGDDLYKAYFAQWRLTETPGQAIPWIEEFFRPVKPVPPERLARWVDDLKSEKFRTRQDAQQRLRAAGELAEIVLRKSLAASTSLEFSRRVQKLLDALQPSSPRRLRLVRTIQVLEFHHTPEAEKLLLTLAGGIPESWQTREARLALERIKKR
jgi:HEAT repeat protein